MDFNTLISIEGLAKNLKAQNWRIIDCRFWLENTEKGRNDYKISHIPGALYAHLDEDLSGQRIDSHTGRHPLPDVKTFSCLMGEWGIDNDTQVVVYDDRGGMIAVRLWWMLNWLGHESVAVLDGGFTNWVKENHPVTKDIPTVELTEFIPEVNPDLVVTEKDILDHFGDPGFMIVDSRAPERFRGEVEPIDPVAGRIPGAVNRFWHDNLDDNEFFKLKDILRGSFIALFDGVPTQNVIFYCGSGVTSAHNVLAVKHAGLGMPKIYIGSWSHWIVDPERPILSG